MYYDNQGSVKLYSTTWRVVTYFNLKELHDKFEETQEQVTIVRASLTGVNQTINAVTRNTQIIADGIMKLSKHVEDYENSTNRKIQHTLIVLTITEQLMQISNMFNELEREYDLLISAIVNAQKGLLEPHLINPVQVVTYLELIKEDLKDKKFPVELTKDQGYLLLRIIDIDVVLAGNTLSYVLNIPLVDSSVYTLYRIWPLPAEYDATNKLFAYIEPERNFLLIDDAKRQYALLSRDQLQCKTVTARNQICKQRFVLMSTYDHERCEARMLQPMREIPKDCNQNTSVAEREGRHIAPSQNGRVDTPRSCGARGSTQRTVAGPGGRRGTSKQKVLIHANAAPASHRAAAGVERRRSAPSQQLHRLAPRSSRAGLRAATATRHIQHQPAGVKVSGDVNLQ
ncbi:uncharacterized protein LOC124613661 [Schistocerca americana]|uniref:uncharacterized protein LOC124613661 n=1 Tax=Schistocerca americana TaxID=7009 RepID=UPI001F504001|nr:uncharacterized protein LOC124613661 [Schistocerca americana]